MPSTVNKRCVVYILAKRVRLQTVSLKFLRILLNKGYNMLNNTKNPNEIATYEVSVSAWRHWRCDVVDVLAVVIFGKKLVPKARYGTLWSFLTYGYHKLQLVKIIATRFCETWNRILKACISLKPEGDEKWKPRNSINSDQLCLMSTRHFWKMYRKWKLPNLRFYDVFRFKSMKSAKSPQNSILCTLWHNFYAK